MNLRKHIAGFSIFSIIVGSAIFLNYYLTLPNATIPPVRLHPIITNAVESPDISYKVRMVSLDFTDRSTGYTSLSLKLRQGRPAPEKLWVTTFYFSPEVADSWSSTTEIQQPFAKSNEIELVAADSWNWKYPVRIGIFARVYVSTAYTENSYPPDIRFDRNITDAIPVVVQWPDVIQWPDTER
ncbi:MAG TPA: hypothetical protein VKB86_13625 [Pyrinomonadaceae bacterium]|nr:hypothetical protein [Pyrinomonadaceae bacterium]